MRRLVRVDRKGRHHSESKHQHQQVIAVDLERALPQPGADIGRILHQFANVETADQQRRDEYESLSRRHEADGLIHEVAEARGKMRQRHPHEEEPAQGVEFGTAFELVQHHPFPSERPGRERGMGVT